MTKKFFNEKSNDSKNQSKISEVTDEMQQVFNKRSDDPYSQSG
jgi:hypothetical protein